MKYLRIILKPIEPYFLGNERSARYGDSSQLSLTDPYYLISEKTPSQTSLFGILRFLGIRTPQTSFHLSPEDAEYIGNYSFQAEMNSASADGFGKIRRIGPLRLIHLPDQVVYARAPLSHQLIHENEPNVYRKLVSVETTAGERWIPENYDHKAWKQYAWYSVNSSDGIHFLDEDKVFETVDQVGVNLLQGVSGRPGGFFKKQYVKLDMEYAFCFEAELEEDAFGETHGFTPKGSRLVTMGKGHSGFVASWDSSDTMMEPVRNSLLPELPLIVNGRNMENSCVAWCASDLLTSLKIEEIKQECMLVLGSSHQHRDFSTVYSSGSRQIKQEERYRKGSAVFRLLSAGSVLYFRDTNQLDHFIKKLEQDKMFLHGKTVGWNSVVAITNEGYQGGQI